MSEFPLMPELLVESLGWTLLHFLWQGALVAALFAGLRLALHGASPRLRLWLGYVALLALAVAPVLTFLRHIATTLPGASAGAAPARAVAGPVLAVQGTATAPALIEAALPWLVCAWLLGVLALSVRGWRQWRGLRRLCAVALPADAYWQQRLRALGRRMGVTQAVQLRECALVAAPMLVGWLKPVILLPAELVLRLPAAQVELLLAHELAHVRRLDYLANLLQLALETVLFYHPAVHWISRCVRDDREQCCDDLVTASGADRLDYARALLTLAEQNLPPPAQSMAMAATGGALLARIERIVEVPRSASPAAAATPLLVLAGALLLVAFGLRAFGPAERGEPLLPAPMPAFGLAGADLALPVLRLAVADLGAVLQAQRAPVLLDTPPAQAAAAAAPQPPAVRLAAPMARAAVAPQAMPVEIVPAPAAGAPFAPALLDAAAPAAAAAEAASEGPLPLRVREPVYPRNARLAGIEGWVRLSYSVDDTGHVYDMRVEDAHPSRVFVPAARAALARWRFAAAGPAAGMRLRQTFDFRLEGHVADGVSHCEVATGSHLCRESR